jgi:hypothetical protein
MGFREQILLDVQNISESNEFFTLHNVDGTEMYIMLDDDELSEREKSKTYYTDGIYENKKLFYVTEQNYGHELPVVGSTMYLDEDLYLITAASSQDGLYIITLGVNAT